MFSVLFGLGYFFFLIGISEVYLEDISVKKKYVSKRRKVYSYNNIWKAKTTMSSICASPLSKVLTFTFSMQKEYPGKRQRA